MPRKHTRTGRCRGRLCRAVMLSALLAGGCESWRSAKNDHPVLGPPPPRLSQDEVPAMRFAEADGEGSSSAGLVKVSLTDPQPLSDHAVVAIVNGQPILAGQLLAPFRPYYSGKPDWQANQIKKEIIGKRLDRRIDEVLLVQALELMLKPEQLKQMNEMLDKEFEKKSQGIMEGLKVNSKIEAEKMLSKQSTSLAEYEQEFKTQQLAALYMQEKMGALTPVIGRQEILDYYDANLKKYEHPARAQFQLLAINYGGKVSKDDAKAKLRQALDALDAGQDFATVAKQFSEGPRADRGGQWDWLKPGEFADPNVDRALFELPVGQVSNVFETENGFAVVRVTKREPAGRTPVADVQDQIRQALLSQAQERNAEVVLNDLRDKAVITKYLD
jgi:parvulin-like peptidyl-prolyl isomerase